MSRVFVPTPYVPDPAVHPIAIQVPFLKLGKSRLENGVDVTPSRCALATVTFKVPLPSAESQRSLFMPGACPMLYDGARVHEAGFQHYPEGIRAVGINTGSGALTNAQYGIAFAYEWEDSKGVLHRSDVSVPLSVALGANNALSCRVPHLRITDKQERSDNTDTRRQAVRIVGYRTVANGTIYYRDNNTLPANIQNDTGALDDATIIFETSDANLIKNELVYPTGRPSAVGGIGFGNDAFPSSTICCNHQRRTFFVCQEEQSFLQYTDETDDRFLAQATNEIYRIPIPVEGGSPVGLISMDEKLIIFCQRRIYFVFGEGPNLLGQQNGYSLPQLCSSLVGMLGGGHQSAVLTPDGVWFLSSSAGFRLLTRGLQIATEEGEAPGFVGMDADGLVSSSVSSIRAATVDANSLIRWYLSDSTVISYDYAQKVWSRQTNHNSLGGAVAARSTFWHSDGTHLFSALAAAGGSDAGTLTPQVLESAWIKGSDVQGWQRVYALMILAEAVSDCTVQIEEGYDFVEAYVSQAIINLGTAKPALRVQFNSGVGVIPPTITGGTSGAVATVIVSSAGLLPGAATPAGGTFFVQGATDVFTPGEALTGAGFTGTATIVTFAIRTTERPQFADILDGLAGGWRAAVVTPPVGTLAALGYFFSTVSTFSVGAWTDIGIDENISISRQFIYNAVAAAPLQIEHRISRQTCEAFRFRLTITPGSEAEGLRLTNFALSIGMKRGLFKLPSAQRF